MKLHIVLLSILMLLSANFSWAAAEPPAGAEETMLKINAAKNTTELLSDSDYRNATDGILSRIQRRP